MNAVKLAQLGKVILPFIEAYKHAPLLMDQIGRGEFAWAVDGVNRNGKQAHVDARSESEDPDLTRREQEILTLIEMGMSNREMAERLVIAEGTLKRHVANIYQKLGVHNRTQAIKQFYRQ